MMRPSMTCQWIKSLSSGCLFVIALGVGSAACARETVITPDLSRIDDSKSWRLINGDCQAATEGGAVYFRPFNFLRDGFQDHTVQYVSWPVNTWEKLRSEKPGQFEATVKPVPDPTGWFHARIEVTKQKVSVWVDDARQPSLVVNRLAGREKGGVGLWVDSRGGTFRNFKIVPTK